MKKPHIFIAIHYLEIGGAETSLIGLLDSLDANKVDVDLFVYAHRGELMSLIPSWIRLLPEVEEYSMIERPLSEVVRKGYYRLAIDRIKARVVNAIPRRKTKNTGIKTDERLFQLMSGFITPHLPRINDDVTYDVAINFCGIPAVVLEKVKARKKVTWLHTDYSTVALDAKLAMAEWGPYDNIISISKDVTSAFTSVFPQLASKIVEIENILPESYIKKQVGNESIIEEYDSDSIKLLSIGRYCTQKNFDNVPFICRRLVEMGLNLKWYIIGYGPDELLIRSKIEEAGMEEHVILLGKKTNPYPYIKACDIYVQPSRYEGKSVTVREAQMLCKPVAITAYPTAKSQIRNGVDGVIVPLDNEGCARGLAEFIKDIDLQESIVGYLHTHDYSNASEIEKIYQLLSI